MTLERLKLIVARIEAPQEDASISRGTAFLISKDLVMTCAHCLGARPNPAEPIKLRFNRWPNDRDQLATVFRLDRDNDTAILKLVKAAEVDIIPLAGRGMSGDEWETFGHPTPVGDDGHRFAGSIADAQARFHDQDVMALDCEAADDLLKGASGSPLMVGGRIVGMWTNQLLGYASLDQESVKPFYNTLYAMPIERLLTSNPSYGDFVILGPTRQQVTVRVATELTRAAMMKRIDADGKYLHERYVQREDINASFGHFLAQADKSVFLVVAKAGAGKTTALGHLALNRIDGPGLYFRGSVDDYSIEAIEKSIDSLTPDSNIEHGRRLEWSDLMKSLQQTGSRLLIFIDAINETKFAEIPERRRELQLLLEQASALPIHIVISCRDVFWQFFIDPRGQTNDFWWQYVYDPTYPARCVQAKEQARKRIADADRELVGLGDVKLATEDELQAREKEAVRLVAHRPSLMLGDFTQTELSEALDRYRLRVESMQIRTQLRHPLLLRLYADIAAEDQISELMTQGALLGRYIEFKIAAVQKAVLSHDGDAGSRLLGALAAEMRKHRYGKIKSDVLEKLVIGNPDLQAIRTYLLDEGLILEYFDDDLVGFQFDALFEYVLSLQIFKEIRDPGATRRMEKVADAIVAEASQFESLVGAVEYSCADMETEDPTCCRRFLVALAETSTFGRDLFLRVVNQLNDPLHEDLTPSLLEVLGDPLVRSKIAREVLCHAVEVSPLKIDAFLSSVALKGSDTALERCAEAMSDAKFSPGRRVAIVAQLLKSPSVDGAFAAVVSLLEIVGDGDDNSAKGLRHIGAEFLKPLSGSALNGQMSFVGMMQLTAGFLPELVGRTDPGEIGKIVGALLKRPEFTPILHVGNLARLCREWIDKESDEISSLVEASNNNPALSLALAGVVTQTLAEKPRAKEWLLGVFLRTDLNKAPGMNLAWNILLQALQIYPDIVDKVIAKLTPSEAASVQNGMDTRGLSYMRGLSKISVMFMDFIMIGSVSIYSCLGLLPWLPGGNPGTWTVPATIESAVAIALHFGIVLLIVELGQRMVLSLSTTKRLMVTGAGLGVAGALLAFPQPAAATLVLAAVFVLAVAASRTLIPSIKNLAFQFEINCAIGLACLPLIWLLKDHVPAIAAAFMVAIGCRLVRLWAAPLYVLVTASMAIAPLRAAVVLGIAALPSSNWHGSLSDLVAATILSCLIVSTPLVIVMQYRSGALRGFPGWLLVGLILAAMALTSAVLCYFSLWLWMVVIVFIFACLLLPSSNPLAWTMNRVLPALEQIIVGGIAGLIIWWRWDPNDGLAMLSAMVALWTSLWSFATLIGVVATYKAHTYQKELGGKLSLDPLLAKTGA